MPLRLRLDDMHESQRSPDDWNGEMAAIYARVWAFIFTLSMLGSVPFSEPVRMMAGEPPPASATSAPADASGPSADAVIALLQKEEAALVQDLTNRFSGQDKALALIGDSWRFHGASAQAVSYWEAALKLNPARPDILVKLGALAAENEEYEKAIGFWRQALAGHPQTANIHYRIGQALLDWGKPQAAVAELEAELRIAPQSVTGHYLLGQACFALKEYERAKACYEAVMALDPAQENARLGLYNVYNRLHQPDKAQEYLKLCNLNPQDRSRDNAADQLHKNEVHVRQNLARLFAGAAELYLEQGNNEKAEALLKNAIGLDPASTDYLLRLAALYQRLKRTEEAIQTCEKALAIDPENQLCFLNIGTLAAQLQRFEQAEPALKRAIELGPERPEGYRELARLYLRVNRKTTEALALAKKGLEYKPGPEDYFIYSWACDLNGDSTNALQALEKAIQMNSGNQKYKQLYETILAHQRR